MTQKPFFIRVAGRASALTFAALALTSPAGAFASETNPGAQEGGLVSESDARELRRIQARAAAERKRDEREAKERLVAASQSREAEENEVVAPLAQQFTTEAGSYIDAAMQKLGMDAVSSAQAAGILVGLTGPLLYNRLMDVAAVEEGAVGDIFLDMADASTNFLEERYNIAQAAGEGIRYAFLSTLALGAFYFGRKAFVPARVIRRQAAKSPRKESLMFRLSRLFGRKQSPERKTEAAAHPILVSYDMDVLKDYIINLLFARGRHDLSGCRDMVTLNLARILEAYFRSHEARGQWNKVERVSNVSCQELESWQEGDTSFVKLLVSWKAIDYVVNFNRHPHEHGFIVEGHPGVLDSFSEEWTVVRRAGESWLVDVMCPASQGAKA